MWKFARMFLQPLFVPWRLPCCHKYPTEVHLHSVTLQCQNDETVPKQGHGQPLKLWFVVFHDTKESKWASTYHPLEDFGLFVGRIGDESVGFWEVSGHSHQEGQEAKDHYEGLEDSHMGHVRLFTGHECRQCRHKASEPHPLPQIRLEINVKKLSLYLL